MADGENEARNTFRLLQRMYRMAVLRVACAIAFWYFLRKKKMNKTVKSLSREQIRDDIMKRIVGSDECRHLIRMGPRSFMNLCDLLVRRGGLRVTRRASVEEQVAKFLYVMGHQVTNREIQFFFRRSGETISRHIHNVLDAVIELEDLYMVQPDGTQVHPTIHNNSRFYPFFKDCIGAIDGTHIRCKVSSIDVPKYRGRKDYPTQNVLAACDFDLKFTYVLAGWEGTASDSRILKNAFQKPNPLRIPEGKYYLGDGGFMLTRELLTPYREQRYHLSEYSRNPPRNSHELFNNRHSILRNHIERAFGILKKRFKRIASANEPHYGVRTQTKIILACCILHNYLIDVDRYDDYDDLAGGELSQAHSLEDQHSNRDEEDAIQGDIVRESIANAMWSRY